LKIYRAAYKGAFEAKAMSTTEDVEEHSRAPTKIDECIDTTSPNSAHERSLSG
jgi:hypothetical protein